MEKAATRAAEMIAEQMLEKSTRRMPDEIGMIFQEMREQFKTVTEEVKTKRHRRHHADEG